MFSLDILLISRTFLGQLDHHLWEYRLTISKVRMQTASPGQYTGAIDVVRKTIAADGIKG